MERFALVGGIVLAIAFGVAPMIDFRSGNGEWNEGRTTAFVEPVRGDLPRSEHQVQSVRLHYVAARIEVIPSDQTGVSIEIANPGAIPMPEISERGSALFVDGRLSGRIRHCGEDGRIVVADYGRVAVSDLPLITLRTPRDVKIDILGAVNGEVQAANNVEIHQDGCGEIVVREAAGQAEITNVGPGTIWVDQAATASFSPIGGSAIHGGRIGALRAEIRGSGDIEVAEVLQSLDAEVLGSGTVRVGRAGAEGAPLSTASMTIRGSGEIYIDGGAVNNAEVEIQGSGDVDVAATAAIADVGIQGSGDVVFRAQVGEFTPRIHGSGDVVLAMQPTRMVRMHEDVRIDGDYQRPRRQRPLEVRAGAAPLPPLPPAAPNAAAQPQQPPASPAAPNAAAQPQQPPASPAAPDGAKSGN